jgi:NitT/TauT family transport system substrate-binding protein
VTRGRRPAAPARAWRVLPLLALLLPALGAGAPGAARAAGADHPRGDRADLVLAAQAAAPAGDAAASGARLGRIRVAYFPILYNLPLCVAHELGLWRAAGLESELVPLRSGPLVLSALQSGDADFAVPSFDGLVHLKERSQRDVIAIASVLTRLTMSVVVHRDVAAARGVGPASPLAERLRALRGLTLGVTQPGAVSDLYARYFLRRAGADPDRDASLVAIGDGSALMAALRTRQIHGYVLSAPTPQIAEREGFATILIRPSQGDVPELTDFAPVVVVTGRQQAARQPEQVAAFLSGLARARRMVVEGPRSAAVRGVVQKHFPGMTDDVLAISLDDVLPALSRDGRLSEPMIRRTLEVLADTGQIPPAWRARSAAEGDLWTNRFQATP